MEEFIGNYKVLREIGKGGMGIVYKAMDPGTKKPVAVKVLPPGMVDRSTVERFRREVTAIAKLKHKNIVESFGHGMAKGQHFMAMEFVDGEPLNVIIKNKGKLSVYDALLIGRQVAEVLVYAHTEANIVHRDIKPANIMVTKDGTVKVMDFGLVQIAGVTRLTMDGSAIGTPEYMSPEQFNDQDVDFKTDIYSLGATLYEILSGTPPFTGENFHAIFLKQQSEEAVALSGLNKDVPKELENIISRAMAKDVNQRYQTSKELLNDLNAMIGTLNESDKLSIFSEEIIGRTTEVEAIKEDSKPEFSGKRVPYTKMQNAAKQRPMPEVEKPSYAGTVITVILCLVFAGLIFVKRDSFKELTPDFSEMAVKEETAQDLTDEAEDFLAILERAEGYFEAGEVFEESGQIHKAIKEYKKAIKLRKNYGPYYRNLALAYESINNKEMAIKAWKDLLKYDESNDFNSLAQKHLNKLGAF